MATPWEFNIAPESRPSQKDSNLPTIIFHGQYSKIGGANTGDFEDEFTMVEVICEKTQQHNFPVSIMIQRNYLIIPI